METKMLVTQALDERDLLVKKICDKIQKASFVETKKHNEENVSGQKVPQKEFEQQAKSSYQQLVDMITRFDQIDRAILQSNAKTRVKTSYGEMSVASALSLRSRLKGMGAYDEEGQFEELLMHKMLDEYQNRVTTLELKNRGLEKTAEDMRLSILGKDVKTKDETPLKVVDTYIKENMTELIDPLYIKDKINSLQNQVDTVLKELDTQIKVSNATTFVEIH